MISIKKILYLGWLGYNNLGDELMWEIFNRLCKNYLGSHCEVTPSPPDITLEEVVDYDTVVLGGGSILLPDYINWVHQAAKMDKKIIVWGSGYDWADKDFVELLDASRRADLMDDRTKEALEDIVDKAGYFGVRGPLTYSVLESANLDMDKVSISGDPGLLLKSDKFPTGCPIIKWSNKEKIIALNWGTSKNDIYGEDEEYVEDQLAEACEILLKQNYKIYMYSMWPIDIVCSRRLYNKIGYNRDVICDAKLYSAGELMRILKKCTLSINFKLHGNVIAAAAGCPFICLGYRFKCFDFVKSMDLEELIVPTDEKNIVRSILEEISFINANRTNIVKTLHSCKQMYSGRLLRPFIMRLF